MFILTFSLRLVGITHLQSKSVITIKDYLRFGFGYVTRGKRVCFPAGSARLDMAKSYI